MCLDLDAISRDRTSLSRSLEGSPSIVRNSHSSDRIEHLGVPHPRRPSSKRVSFTDDQFFGNASIPFSIGPSIPLLSGQNGACLSNRTAYRRYSTLRSRAASPVMMLSPNNLISDTLPKNETPKNDDKANRSQFDSDFMDVLSKINSVIERWDIYVGTYLRKLLTFGFIKQKWDSHCRKGSNERDEIGWALCWAFYSHEFQMNC